MRNYLGLALALTLGLVGCSRKAGDTSTVRLSFSNTAKYSAPSADPTIPHTIIINVSGPGIPTPILVPWDGHCSDTAACTPPEFFDIPVPKGSARLIQVLLVYGGGSMTFKYGDMTKDLVGGNETVSITVADIGSAAIEGTVAGRYLDNSPLGGPTGVLEAQFLPSGNRPAMTVMRSTMIAGWFNIFLLDTANFTYLLNGKVLFDKVNINSSAFDGHLNHVRINIPPHDRSNGQSGVESDGAAKLVLGYFGPNAGSNTACYNYVPSGVGIPQVFQPGTSSLLMYSSGTSASNLWVHPEGGGTLMTASPCTSASSLYVDHLNFDEKALINGKDSVAGFKGPWRLINGSAVTSTTSGNNMTLTWNFLPDTTKGADGITGVSAFIRTRPANQTNDIEGQNGIACSRLADFGFVNMNADVPMTAADTNGTMTLAGVTPDKQVVLCPFLGAAKIYPDLGTEVYSFGGGGGGPNMLKLTLSADGTSSDNFAISVSNTQTTMSCKRYVVDLRDQNDALVAVTGSTPMNITFAGLPGGSGLFTGMDCGTSSNAMIPVGTSSTRIYLKGPSTFQSVNLNYMGNGDQLFANGGMRMNFVNSSNTSSFAPYSLSSVIQVNPSTLVKGQCYPVDLSVMTMAGYPTWFSASTTPGLTLSSPGGGNFFSTPDCTVALGTASFAIPAYTASVPIYYVPTGTSASEQITAQIAGAPSAATNTNFIVDDPAVMRFVPQFNNGTTGSSLAGNTVNAPSGCTTFSLQPMTANNGMIYAQNVASQSVGVTATSGFFYSSGDCTGTPQSTISYPWGGSNTPLSYASVGSTASMIITAASGSTSQNVVFGP